jgi:SOS response regulatory protein OraA/RecX
MRQLEGEAMSADKTFADFWTAYPRKVGKGDARKAYACAARKVKPEAILDALRRQTEAGVFGCERQFVPYPASWLRGERWDDEIGMAAVRSAADDAAERWRDACRRGDERGKAAIKAEAARRGTAWADVTAALARLNGGV